jgi:hypothetical protein
MRHALEALPNMPPTPALSLLQLGPGGSAQPMTPASDVLGLLRDRVRQATSDEVEARWKLLLQQLETLARLTARELARKGPPDPVTLRAEVDSLEQRLQGVSGGSVELFACRITCRELSERAAPGRRRVRAGALEIIERVRLDARALFEWAKSDLWTGVARRAIIEANRTALDLERESAATICRVQRTLARVRGPGATLPATSRVTSSPGSSPWATASGSRPGAIRWSNWDSGRRGVSCRASRLAPVPPSQPEQSSSQRHLLASLRSVRVPPHAAVNRPRGLGAPCTRLRSRPSSTGSARRRSSGSSR